MKLDNHLMVKCCQFKLNTLIFYTSLTSFAFRSWDWHSIGCWCDQLECITGDISTTIIILLQYVGTVSFDDSSASTGISPTATGNNTEKREVLSTGSGTNNFVGKLVSGSVGLIQVLIQLRCLNLVDDFGFELGLTFSDYSLIQSISFEG